MIAFDGLPSADYYVLKKTAAIRANYSAFTESSDRVCLIQK